MTAAFLHFFFLSSFCWVLTEAWQSYLAVIGRIRTRLVRKRFLCLGWGKSPAGLVLRRGEGGHRAPLPGIPQKGKLRQLEENGPGCLGPFRAAPSDQPGHGELPEGPHPVPLGGGWRGGGAGRDDDAPPVAPASSPLSRVASPRGRGLRRLHADQRLRDIELVRGDGGDTGLGTGTTPGWQQCRAQGLGTRRPLSVSP